MSRWVNQTERVAEDVSVAIKRLRVGGAGNDGIGTGKAANQRSLILTTHCPLVGGLVASYE